MRHRPQALLAAALIATALPALAESSSTIREESFRRLNEGVRLLKLGDARGAAGHLCWVARHALNSHDAYWYCGQARLAARDPEGAIKALEVAADLDPRHLGTQVALGDANLAAGRIDAARAAFYRALEIRKDHSPAWDGLARLAQRTGDTDKALELFDKALVANAADARARLHRGQVRFALGRLAEGLADVREAARLRPDDGAVQLGLAEAALSAQLFEEALAAARRVRELTPQDARGPVVQAQVFLALSALPEAEEAAREAVRLDQGSAAARIALAEALGRTGRLDEALTQLAPPGESGPVDVLEAPRLDAPRKRWEARRDELAALDAQAAAPEAPAELLVRLAEAKLATGDAAAAAPLAVRACAAAAAEPALARRVAFVLAGTGRLLAAEALLAGLAAPTAADRANLGVLRELTGDPDGARAAYEAAAAQPDAPVEARAGLARLALARGDRAAAIAALEALVAANPPPDDAAHATEALRRLRPPAPEKKP